MKNWSNQLIYQMLAQMEQMDATISYPQSTCVTGMTTSQRQEKAGKTNLEATQTKRNDRATLALEASLLPLPEEVDDETLEWISNVSPSNQFEHLEELEAPEITEATQPPETPKDKGNCLRFENSSPANHVESEKRVKHAPNPTTEGLVASTPTDNASASSNLEQNSDNMKFEGKRSGSTRYHQSKYCKTVPLIIRPTEDRDLRKMPPTILHAEIAAAAGVRPNLHRFSNTGALTVEIH